MSGSQAASRSSETSIEETTAERFEEVKPPGDRQTNLWIWGQRVLLLAAILLIWQIASGTMISQIWISKPSLIFAQLYEWIISGEIFFHTWITLQETVLGFLIGAVSGCAVGLVLGQAERVAIILEPFIMAVYSLPKVALAPLFIVWFGIGIQMKIALAALIVFFLVFFNTFSGVRNVDKELIDTLRLMGASKFQLLHKVMLPSALTWIFAGLKISVPYALIGAIVGEVIAANRGLGFLVQSSANQYAIAGVFAALFVIMIISTIMNACINTLEHRYTHWKDAA
jgi:NitT/TauT family transport system permease protein